MVDQESAAAKRKGAAGTARKIFDSYDGFLGILADKEKRAALEELKEEAADTDATYAEARDLSHEFRDGLLEFFFDTKSGMSDLTRNYGVF